MLEHNLLFSSEILIRTGENNFPNTPKYVPQTSQIPASGLVPMFSGLLSTFSGLELEIQVWGSEILILHPQISLGTSSHV